jgi:hypothetical protein
MSEHDIESAVSGAIKGVTSAWKLAKRRADRADRVSGTQLRGLRRCAAPRVTIRDAAFDAMEDAYLQASADGKYYANARQIMYAARPAILSQCDAEEFDDVYFTQTLLKDFIEEFDPDWKVVWDARGNLSEPHTGKRVPLGGIGVAAYLAEWHEDVSIELPSINFEVATGGPANRFANVLFIEKEGFAEILADANIGARFDMAIMSTKGLPVKAACDLIAALDREHVRIFALRDFDYSGFKIVRTLHEGTRLAEGSPVIDLGLRIEDTVGLESEPCSYSTHSDPRWYLQSACGATSEECQMLVAGGYPGRWSGRRVEINAMTSDQLIAWLERKFAQHGVKKIIPNEVTLRQAFKRAVVLKRLEQRIEEIEGELLQQEDLPVLTQLSARIKAMLKKDPTTSWDAAVAKLADEWADSGDTGQAP